MKLLTKCLRRGVCTTPRFVDGPGLLKLSVVPVNKELLTGTVPVSQKGIIDRDGQSLSITPSKENVNESNKKT
jgi:hypothetical protein